METVSRPNNDTPNGAMMIDEVMRRLPHRYPFLLIDRVLELVIPPKARNRVGRRVRAQKNVTMNESFFNGHFPYRPIMPGVLIIEAMAQAAGITCYSEDDPPMEMTIASVYSARFRRPVIPGDVLILQGEIVKDRGRMLLFSCQASVDDQIVAETEILAHHAPRTYIPSSHAPRK